MRSLTKRATSASGISNLQTEVGQVETELDPLRLRKSFGDLTVLTVQIRISESRGQNLLHAFNPSIRSIRSIDVLRSSGEAADGGMLRAGRLKRHLT
jgi:hypothetical protein